MDPKTKKTKGQDALEVLRAQLVEIHEREQAIQAMAEREGRTLTDEEVAELDELANRFEEIDADLKRREAIAARGERLSAPQPRVTRPADLSQASAPTPSGRITGGEPAGATPGSWGWRTFGEYAQGVRAAAISPANMDDRLKNAATTYGNEATPSDGGFAVPPDFRQEIMRMVAAEESLLARTDQLFTTSNRMTFPQDNTTPWQTSGGVQAYWEDEASTLTQSKPQLEAMEIALKRLTALVPVTDELLEDVPALNQYLPSKVSDKFTSRINDAIVSGNGVGKPLGLLNSGSKVVVAKEAGQAAATLKYENIVNMWSRLSAPLRAGAVWLINQDIEPQLFSLVAPGANFPAYLPPNGLSASPFSTLLGRPVIPVESCETLGTEGDIILTNLRTYALAQKVGGGVRQDVSIHVYFDQVMTAFRFIMRIGGQSWWNAPISPKKGVATRSNIVTLATRA